MEQENNPMQTGDYELRKKIEEYYLPAQLIEAILQRGQIPETTEETYIGIGFIDIADYSYLSKFLTPKENQILLNGLYTAFQSVLLRRGGYLNKIEGDSMMFHFGGSLDRKMDGLELEKQIKLIAKELFYSCIEMQRVCALFNQASESFMNAGSLESDQDEKSTREAKKALTDAFAIIEALRSKGELLDSFNAFFQIRIRIGASMGEVTVGNFGPSGAKQWDVIGEPVIIAKRMETTAPVGGVRISEEFYQILDKYRIVESYCTRLRAEAKAYNSPYRDISNDEVFSYSNVNIKEKKNAKFHSYSVQVNANLPINIADQVESLLLQSEPGAERILELIQYYRGNRYVINAIENRMKLKGVKIRKLDLLQFIFPKKYREFMERNEYTSPREFEDELNYKFSLFILLEKMGTYQDIVKQNPELERSDEPFNTYEGTMKNERHQIIENYKKREFHMVQRAYFFNVVFPLVFASIRNSILEYQASLLQEAEIEELEILEDDDDVQDMEEV
jgi:adenylate cyclase